MPYYPQLGIPTRGVKRRYGLPDPALKLGAIAILDAARPRLGEELGMG